MSTPPSSPSVPAAECNIRRDCHVQVPKSRDYHLAVHEQQGKDILYLLLIFRFINAITIRTFFQPDEYFQSLEPAWQMAFGASSGAWITWEWQHQLRSSLHPAVFALLYYGVDHTMRFLSMYPQFRAMILVYLPKVFQGVVAAAGDFYTWKLAEKIYGQGSNTAWTALLMTVLSPWQWFCSTRTLSNSLEVVLTIVAVYHWPWALYRDASASQTVSPGGSAGRKAGHGSQSSKIFKSDADIKGLRICLLLAGIACVLRPTNLLIWISLVTISFPRLGLSGPTCIKMTDFVLMLREAVICGSFALSISALSDRLYFGTWTFPPYQWLNFNITQSLAVFYGTNRWDYYLTEGFPLLLTTYLPFTLLALFASSALPSPTVPAFITNIRFQLTFTILVTVSTLSLISHKEVRFIYPLLPLLHILTAPHVLSFFTHSPVPPTKSTPPTKSIPSTLSLRRILLLATLLTVNISIALYTTLIHQRGVLDVLAFLRHDYESHYLSERGDLLPIQGPTFAAFLMPCHSTPWRSHLVYPSLTAWSLSCEPPLHIPAGTAERAAYRDEADRFYDDPKGFLDREVGTPDRPWPRYIVGFEGIEKMLIEWHEERMHEWVVVRRWEGFNSHWHDDWRRRGRVVVWGFEEREEGEQWP